MDNRSKSADFFGPYRIHPCARMWGLNVQTWDHLPRGVKLQCFAKFVLRAHYDLFSQFHPDLQKKGEKFKNGVCAYYTITYGVPERP